MATAVLTKGTGEAKEFGQRLAAIRKEKLNMSQAELARNVKREDGSTWHTSYVTNIERGEQPPAREFVEQLAQLAEISVDEILPEGISLDELRVAYRHRRARRSRRNQDSGSNGQDGKMIEIQSRGRKLEDGVNVETKNGVVMVTINVADIVSSALR